jgi:hypothetical protein
MGKLYLGFLIHYYEVSLIGSAILSIVSMARAIQFMESELFSEKDSTVQLMSTKTKLVRQMLY